MKLKKIVSFFLACILAMTYCAAIGNSEQYAVTEQQIEPRYSDFAVIGANLTKADNGLYSAAGSAGAPRGSRTPADRGAAPHCRGRLVARGAVARACALL